MGSHYRFLLEGQGGVSTTGRRDDRSLNAPAFSTGIGACINSDLLCDDRGRPYYWPVFIPPAPLAAAAATQAGASTAALRSSGGQLLTATITRARQLADRAIEMDYHSTGPGPACVIEVPEHVDAQTDEPRMGSESAVATSRFRKNSRLMALMLDGRVVESDGTQDWQEAYLKRRAQRLLLEKKLHALTQETRELEVQQEAQRQQWLMEADVFREKLLKCRQKEHLLEVARTLKVQGNPVVQSTMPGNCKTAFRLKYVP